MKGCTKEECVVGIANCEEPWCSDKNDLYCDIMDLFEDEENPQGSDDLAFDIAIYLYKAGWRKVANND